MSDDVAPIVTRPTRSRVRQPDAATGKKRVAFPPVKLDKNCGPAIYYFETMPEQGDIDDAVGMGFSAIGISYSLACSDALPSISAMAANVGLSVVADIDLVAADGQLHLLDEHPDWFVQKSDGPHFVFLASNDASVDWWNDRIEILQGQGISGFFCRRVVDVVGPIWGRLIESAKQRSHSAKFIAWTPEVSAESIEDLKDVGFDFSISSSCWWDFRAGWLNEDAARLARMARVIALTTPPNQSWPAAAQARLRAVQLAAVYGSGWTMPAGFQRAEDFDISRDVAALNILREQNNSFLDGVSGMVVSSAGADVMVLRRPNLALIANASLSSAGESKLRIVRQVLGTSEIKYLDHSTESLLMEDDLILAPAEGRLCKINLPEPITFETHLAVQFDAPRIAIETITPKVDDGLFPVRRVVGETIAVAADIIGDGHDRLAAEILWRAADEVEWHSAPMSLIANDRWQGEFPLDRIGRYVFVIAAWKDVYATFVDELTKKYKASVPTHLEVEEGLILLREMVEQGIGHIANRVDNILKTLEASDETSKRSGLLSEEIVDLMRAGDLKKFFIQSGEIFVDSEPLVARFASWYEVFPRSQSGRADQHGNFLDVINQLPRIADMGFDVLYFPPIHPIGRINRKGRNNTLTPAPDDPGSPYAIGSIEGGHEAIHPELGSLSDFHALRDAAAKKGIQLALDFAIQCAPDHPWLTDHKDWFDWRPDGSLRYAENPPKKYEDIVNVDFYTASAKPGLWEALRDIVQFWVDQGVRLFRVDNPHTKPLPFWEWMIGDIRSRHPDTIFLAEAFTRPKVMYRLAKIGFSQSYTYFTWRNTKAELTEYLTELNTTAPKEYFRPHFFVNTPDINPVFLHNAGRPGFLIRAALAATLSGLWGVYNGFELCEATSVAPGKEEYLDSEKYQIKVWDYDRPGNIVGEIRRLNHVRRTNAALHSHLGVTFQNASNDEVIYFSKTAQDGNVVLVAISLDPFKMQDANIEVPLWQFGLSDDDSIEAEDLMRDFKFTWHGKNQTVSLPLDLPFCIWRLNRIAAV